MIGLSVLAAALAPLPAVRVSSRIIDPGAGPSRRHSDGLDASSGRTRGGGAPDIARFAAPRVTVRLPPAYERSRRRHRVVYIQDGQDVFFPARSRCGKVWAVDRTVPGLVAAHRIAPVSRVYPGAAHGSAWAARLPDPLARLLG